jgi:hypothetical protein
MADRPAYGTAPIRCGKRKCSWRGYEGDMVSVLSKKFGPGVTDKVCPTCGENGYYFMTEKEIAAWKRKQSKETP